MKLMCLQLCCHHIPVLHWDNVDLHFQAFALQIWFKKFLSWHQDSQGTVNWLQLVALYMWTMICSIWQRDLVYWLLLGLCWLLEVMLSPGGCWEWSPGTEERELDHLADLIRKQANHAKGTLLPVSVWVHPALFAFYFGKEPVLVAMYFWPMVFVCFVFLVKHATCRCATSSWKKPSLGVRSDLSAVLCEFLFCWVFHFCVSVLMVKLMCCWLYFSCCSFRFCVVNPTVALISVYSMFGRFWEVAAVVLRHIPMDIFQYINILVCFEIMSHNATYIGSCFVYVLFWLSCTSK